MKFDLTNWRDNWEKDKKRLLFLMAYPMAISSVLNILIAPLVINASPELALLTPWLSILVFVPFFIIDALRQKAVAARENRELQARHDAAETAMFGKPLREVEL